jgi:lysophospholipase L1-like esterase
MIGRKRGALTRRAAALSAVMAVVAMLTTFSGPGGADTPSGASLAWEVALAGSGQLAVGPSTETVLNLANCGNDSCDGPDHQLTVSYSPDGQLRWRYLPSSSSDFFVGAPSIDGLGNAASIADSLSGPTLVRSLDVSGHARWQTAAFSRPVAVAAGPDNNVYALEMGNDVHNSSFWLEGLSGTDGRSVFHTQTRLGIPFYTLFAYDDGIIVSNGSSVELFGFDGVLQHDYQLPDASQGAFWAASFAGDVFSLSSGSQCDDSQPQTVAKLTAAGGVKWTRSITTSGTHCDAGGRPFRLETNVPVHPLPNGGVLVGSNDERFHAYDKDGNEIWSSSQLNSGLYPDGKTPLALASVLVDERGVIVVTSSFVDTCIGNGGPRSCLGVQLTFLDGTTGARGARPLMLHGHTDDTGFTPGHTAIGRTRAYIVGSTDSGGSKLDAAAVPGLGRDFLDAGRFDASGQGATTTTTAPPTTTTTTAQPSRINYVALGDSFSSGEGNPPFTPPSDAASGCHRSTYAAYSVLVRQDPTFPRGSPPLTFVACSGAVMKEVFETGRDGERPQINSVGRGTDLVTMTVGGNDMGFPAILAWCLAVRPCTGTFVAPWGEDVISNKIRSLYPEFKRRYETLRAGTDGSIYILGYPQLFPEAPSAGQQACIGTMFAPEDLPWFRARTRELNDTIQKAALAAGVRYVDVETAFEDDAADNHELCAANAWVINPLDRENGDSWFHPNQFGQEAFYRALMKRRPFGRLANPKPAAVTPPPQGGPTLSPQVAAVSLLLDGKQWLVHFTSAGWQLDKDVIQRSHSVTRDLSSARPDAAGTLDETFRLPADIEPGFHVIEARGTGADGQQRLVVAPFFIDQAAGATGPTPAAPPVDPGAFYPTGPQGGVGYLGSGTPYTANPFGAMGATWASPYAQRDVATGTSPSSAQSQSQGQQVTAQAPAVTSTTLSPGAAAPSASGPSRAVAFTGFRSRRPIALGLTFIYLGALLLLTRQALANRRDRSARRTALRG